MTLRQKQKEWMEKWASRPEAAEFFDKRDSGLAEITQRYSASRLKQEFPLLYAGVVQMLADPLTYDDEYIMTHWGVSQHTINSIRKAETNAIEQQQEAIQFQLQRGLLMAVEQMIERLPSMNDKDCITAMDKMFDKLRLMQGLSTENLAFQGKIEAREVRESLPSPNQFIAHLKELPKAKVKALRPS